MSIYAIGDVQGCYEELMLLLDKIKFDESKDQLWFTGDLVNRGPNSLAVLRFIKGLGKAQRIVLGNHDLHLLAVAEGVQPIKQEDTLQEILEAPDREVLLEWLTCQPLMLYSDKSNYLMVHAGLAPGWDLVLAKKCAKEVEELLRSRQRKELLSHMYGNQPTRWSSELDGWERKRFILNAFTRIRYCDSEGNMHLNVKNAAQTEGKHLIPWFAMPERKKDHMNIIFGHWAALQGRTNVSNVHALDTGCVWGGQLTAMCLTNHNRIVVESLTKCINQRK